MLDLRAATRINSLQSKGRFGRETAAKAHPASAALGKVTPSSVTPMSPVYLAATYSLEPRLVRKCHAMRQWLIGTAEIANASRIAAKNVSMLLVFTEI